MKLEPAKVFRAVILLIAAVILSACSRPSAPQPTNTPDQGLIETQAMQTMEAFGTATAMAVPTETPIPTYTPFVLPPEDSSQPQGDIPAGDPPAILPGSDTGAVPPQFEESEPSLQNDIQPRMSVPEIPTAEAAQAGDNKATWQSQNPADGSHIEAGSEFDITWYMFNSGTTTWTTDYCMRYFAGTNLTKPGKTRYNLSEPVAPGTVGACSVDAVAPWEAGTYQMSVVLSNENDENFSIVDITIIVD